MQRYNVLCLIWLADDVSLVINVTCLHFDHASQTGRASLRWKLHEDGNSSVWESTVLIRHPTPEGIVMEVQKTTNDETRVILKPDKLYEITVCDWLLVSITFTITTAVTSSRIHSITHLMTQLITDSLR